MQNSSIVLQHEYEVALGPGPSGLDSSALVRHPLWYFSSARERQSSVERESMMGRGSGELAYMDRSPCPWSPIDIMQM